MMSALSRQSERDRERREIADDDDDDDCLGKHGRVPNEATSA